MSTVHEQSDGPGITVERLLAEELLRGSLIGGEAGLANVVTWCVPLTEGPAGSPVLSDDEDMSGVAVYVPSALLAASGSTDLLGRLAQRGVSLILAWPGHGEDQPDLTAAATAADAAQLPLLRLPRNATFRETSRLVATKVLAQSTHVLEYGTRVHRTLGDVFARGGGLSALARTMSQLSGTTILVIDNAGELLATAGQTSSSAEASDVSSARVQQIIELLNPGDYAKDTTTDGPAHVVTLDIDGEKVHVVLAPVEVSGEPYGMLVLIEPAYPAAEHDLSQHVIMAEQGVSLTGSELLRQQSVREAEERARNDFVHALLHGRFTDQLELTARAQHYRFPLDGRFAVFIVTATGLHPDEGTGRRKARDAARATQSVTPDDGRLTLTALIGSMLVIVRQLPARQPSASEAQTESHELSAFGAQLHRAMRQRLGDDVRISYGRPDDGAPGVARSYREARTTEALGRRVTTDAVCSYPDLRVFAAIQEAAMSPTGKVFASDILAPLKQADGQTGNLEEVVLAYIEESGNLNATARRLHLHRNTMLYKLDRASRALQMDVRTTEAQFMIWLAHHLTALSDVVGALDEELAPPT